MRHSIRTAKAIRTIAAVGLGLLAASHAARAAEPQKFLRYVDSPGHASLQTSIVSYTNKDGAHVDLIGAVHIADGAYFETLNQQFKQYDALLYEMVKPKGMTHIEPGHRSGSWVSSMQLFMKSQLDLDFQLDRVDYEAKNFVHADLDAETFVQMQADRGENMMTMMLNSMLREMSKAANDPDNASADLGIMDLIAALQAPDRARQLKLVMAKQFEQMDGALDAMGGPGGSVILDERNKHALAVLKDQLDAGKKHVGIFYGAGHMHGMEELMTTLMGFKQDGPPRWLVAWDLSDPKAAKPTTRPFIVDDLTPTTAPVTK